MAFYVTYILFWLLYCLVWGAFFVKQLGNRPKKLFWAFFSIAALLFAAPAIYLTHDIAVVSYLKDNYCNETMVEIKETVEFPGSVYWEDNVLGGFGADNRRWMVEHYLDGVHLQTLALNGNDGKFYVYHATKEDFKESSLIWQKITELERDYEEESKSTLRKTPEEKEVFLQKMQPNFQQRKNLREKIVKQRLKEILILLQNVRVLNNNETLQFKYVVKKSPILIPDWQNRYLYTDKMRIVDSSSGQIVARANRVLRYKYKTELDVVHSPSAIVGFTVCGLGKLHSLGEDVLFPQANHLRGLVSKKTRVFKISKFDYIVGN